MAHDQQAADLPDGWPRRRRPPSSPSTPTATTGHQPRLWVPHPDGGLARRPVELL